MVVGEEGFEPPTLWSQTRCATKLRYSPTMFYLDLIKIGSNATAFNLKKKEWGG